EALASAAALERADHLSEVLVETARELQASRTKLAERESMARLGEITAGASHEINNPLAVVRGRAEVLATRLRPDSPEHGEAVAICQAAADASGVVEDLHMFSEPGEPDISVASVRSVIAAAREHVGADHGENTVRTTGTDTIAVSVDREHVARALAEVLRNAFDASTTKDIEVAVQIDAAKRRVLLSVKDDGAGFTEKAAKHAFDPFFSERAAGRGRGMGLARAKRWVELCDGTIHIARATPGRAPQTDGSNTGACVSIALPLADEPADEFADAA
ncbi:MAG: HAMP domain-containing sensor histidine kinase, partial [Planctomycetota bacterium]